MARRSGVRYWSTRGTWTDGQGQSRHGAYCTTLRGKQYVLAVGPDDSPSGPTFLKATKAYGDLYCLVHADQAGDSNTCRVVIEYYLRHLSEHGAEKTLRIRQQCLEAFCQTKMADVSVSQLTPFAVESWLSEMRKPRQVKQRKSRGEGHVLRTYKWGDGKVRQVLMSLQAAFNYGRGMRLINDNPIAALGVPPGRSRGRDCVVEHGTHEHVLKRTRGQFREFVICLANTGCRPGELANATAADWNDRLGAIVYHGKRRRKPGEGSHKTAREDKERRIFFTGDALQVMRHRVQRYPRGPLWRSTKKPSNPLSLNTVVCAFGRLAKRLEVSGLTAYSYRHTFATRWLEGGGSIDDLAALLGNTAAVIREHYAHLCDNLDRMRSLAEKFNAERTESPPSVLPFGKAAQ